MPVSPAKHEWIKANEESLVKQSRSFSIPILNLDQRFRIPIMVEYNLNKTIDTIEDSTGLESDEKIYLITTFCEHLERDSYSSEMHNRMLEVTPQEEAFVFKNYQATINLYKTLAREEKELARRWTGEMAEGMCTFLKKPIYTHQDLNEYCYYVAGTVGLYLTNLLRLKGSNITEEIFEKLLADAVSFGRFQQKLNIIRDFSEDKTAKGRSFWPQSYFENADDNVKILNKMCYDVLEKDIPGAIEYFGLLPPGNDSYDYFIRFILCSGIEYWRILKDQESVFSEAKVKLPRKFVQNLYAHVSSQTREQFKNYCQQFYEEEISAWPENWHGA
ncbi:MAG: squalene/phytoene synthase family protein [Deltaproteobacteria bacterium]|nr:squalene/phytoene synthase family protein [Deltaproteobacteria bacterium]